MSPQHHPHWHCTEHAGDIRVNQRIKSVTKKTTHKTKMMTGVWDLMVRCWETRLELLIVCRWMWLPTRSDHWWLKIFVICAVCRLPGASCMAVWLNIWEICASFEWILPSQKQTNRRAVLTFHYPSSTKAQGRIHTVYWLYGNKTLVLCLWNTFQSKLLIFVFCILYN